MAPRQRNATPRRQATPAADVTRPVPVGPARPLSVPPVGPAAPQRAAARGPKAGARVGARPGAQRPAPLGTSQSYEPSQVSPGVREVPEEVQEARLVERWRRLGVLRKLSGKARVKRCKSPIGNGHVGIAGHQGGAHFTGLESCANVWACPVCAPKIRAGRMADVLTAFERHTANGGGFAFLTLTVAHQRGEALALLLELLGGAWTSVARQREYRDWRQRLGLLGSIVALEVTDGANGWHPHRHVMLLFTDPPSRDQVGAFESVLDELYGRWLTKQGRKRGGTDQQTGRLVAVRLDYVPPDDSGRMAQLGKYLTKLQAGFELTRGDLKRSRQAEASGGRLPMDLIDVYAGATEDDDRAAAAARWREYEQAMTGKSAVRFSRGLRAELGMTEDAPTDEELAEEEVDGDDPGVYLTASLYRRLFADGQAAAVMTAHRVAGPAGVLRLVTQLYPGRTLAEEGQMQDPDVLLIGWAT